MSFDSTRRNINNYKEDYDTKDINWNNAVLVGTVNVNFMIIPLPTKLRWDIVTLPFVRPSVTSL